MASTGPDDEAGELADRDFHRAGEGRIRVRLFRGLRRRGKRTLRDSRRSSRTRPIRRSHGNAKTLHTFFLESMLHATEERALQALRKQATESRQRYLKSAAL